MRQPVLFVGHGSPMNAIEDNPYSRSWRDLGARLPRPRAILVISAHWETSGVAVTASPQPDTIHDFGGFPPALHAVRYPVPGDPTLAGRVAALLAPEAVTLDPRRGLDHGSWSVLLPMFPDAGIPVVQLSLARGRDGHWHYSLARRLAALRDEGVLIIASGDMVHNLRLLRWPLAGPEPWAARVQAQFNTWLRDGNHAALQQPERLGEAARLAIPTPEHYLPLLYALALQDDDDELTLFNDEVTGTLSMTSVLLQPR
ncbi:MAG: 4,5-DOPA dioxygenase extradiol [Perlucidibaca sp.]